MSDEAPSPAQPSARPSGWAAACFVALHLSPLLVLATGFRWSWLGWAAGSYALRMFAVSAGYHRYFSHRAFRASRAPQFLLAWVAQASALKGVLWWASHHRVHHKHADGAGDVHAPGRDGFWWSHAGWFLSRRWARTDYDAIKDFSRFPELVWLNEHHPVPFLTALGLCAWLGGLPGVVWGLLLPTLAVWHATFAVSSLAHVLGRRRYLTSDLSRNSLTLALLTGGEGWHNNHHFAPNAANLGWRWWELDLTWLGLRFLSWTGLVRDLRRVKPEVQAAFERYTPEERARLVEESRVGARAAPPPALHGGAAADAAS